MARENEDMTMRRFRRCFALASGLRHQIEALRIAGAPEDLGEMLCEEMDRLFGLLHEEAGE